VKRWVLAVALLSASFALADDPKVPVQAEVVFASTEAGTIDPSLVKMRDTLAPKVKYLTLKKLDSRKLVLVKNKAETIALPNAKTAELSLDKVENDVATVKVKVPPTEATYKLAHEKVLYVQGGEHKGGQVWLLLSQPQ
jgi:hypothetical protein